MNVTSGPALFRALLLSAACLSAGCAHYEYDIVEPPDLRQHVGESADTVCSRSPLVYRLRSYENHLVMQIQNPTPQPIQLLGGQSYIVDPQGQSHPLATVTIAPNAFIKLILPPLPPPPMPTGPSFGFGFVVDAADISPSHAPAASQWVRPRYASAEMGDEYWTWDGETDVRVSLTFRQGDQPPFTHAFVFHRRKT
jgi:hypothetical protein